MPQLEYFEDFFEKFTAGYDTVSDEICRGIQIKKYHSLEVYKFAGRICNSLNLSKSDYLAAMTAALFHDVGRFEQFKNFKTFNDRDSLNHAACGVRVLRELGILNEFTTEARKDILAAIACHNRPRIPERLSVNAALYCKIVRDADKLDIFRVVIEVYESGVYDPVILLNLDDSDTLTPDVAESVTNGRPVLYNNMNTTADFKVLQLGWFDEFYFPESLHIAAEKCYAEKIFNTLPDILPVRHLRNRITEKFIEAGI